MDDYTIDVTKIEALITEKTTAIIPVHVFGNVCNIEAIEQLAKKYNLKVIYDAAHAFGVKYKNKSIANYGDISMYSFHATKVFHTLEGGCLTFNNPIYKEKLESYKNFGLSEDYSIKYIGTNSKMNEFQAAMGICNLRYIDEEIIKRSKVINKYYEKLQLISGIKLLPDIVDTPKNFSHFPVIFDGFKKSRDQIYDELMESNIHTKKYFYPLTSEADYFNQEYDINKTPIAKFISERVLILPLYGDLELDIVEKICNIILS